MTREYRPAWAIESGTPVGPCCPDKTAVFRYAEGAEANARSEEQRRGIPLGSYRHWQHISGCGYWHISKAGTYKAWMNGGLHASRRDHEFDMMEVFELGERVIGCGRIENFGPDHKRRKSFLRFRRTLGILHRRAPKGHH